MPRRPPPLTAEKMMGELMTRLLVNAPMGIVEFTEDVMLNGDTQLYPPQRALLRAFYNEPLTEQDQVLLREWTAENRTTWVPDRNYQNLVLEAGRRSGKSTLVSAIVLYEFYLLINLPNPAKHYGLISGDPVDIFVIAQSMDQATETLFGKVRSYAQGSVYFKSLVDRGEIEILGEKIRHPGKNVTVYAKHTNAPSLVGYNLKLLVLDEAARFEQNDLGESKADEMWSNVGAATMTFGDDGRKVMISSAWKRGDCMEKYYKLAERDATTVAFRMTTWHLNLNPRFARDTPTIQSAYLANVSRARLEYEGIRSEQFGSFILLEDLERASTGIPAVDARYEPLDVPVDGDLRKYVGVEVTRLVRSSSESFIHCDFGVRRDAAAIALASNEFVDGRWIVSIDGILQWKPRRDDTGLRSVSMLDVEEKLLDLSRARNVKQVTFDSFQSEATIQRLHLHGVNTSMVGSSRTQQVRYFTLFNQLLKQGIVRLPRDGTWALEARLELSGLVLLDNSKIVHPFAGKDLADAIVLATWNAYQWQVKSGMINHLAPRMVKVGANSNSSQARTPNPAGTLERRVARPGLLSGNSSPAQSRRN